MQTIWLDATDFNLGGWQLETQFVRGMGCPYLIAIQTPGESVTDDAVAEFKIREDGLYRFFVYTKNWKSPEAPGQFCLKIDGEEYPYVCEKLQSHSWYFEIGAEKSLSKGKHTVALHDLTGWLSRCGAVVITNDEGFYPSREIERFKKQRAEIKGITNIKPKRIKYDFAVVGAGPGGVPTAVAAARKGLKTVLVCSRPAIGGNASDEGFVGLDGASAHHRYWHETGIANEIKRNHEEYGISWQKAMEMLTEKEKKLTVLYNELCIDAKTENGKIKNIRTVNTLTLNETVISAEMFADCTGDAWLGYYAGAKYTLGRESKQRYNEELAIECPDYMTMSGCIGQHLNGRSVRSFYAATDTVDRPFTLPDWAIKLPVGEDGLKRKASGFSGSDWWMENSQDFDDTFDDELVRDELVRLSVSYFGWIKASYPEASKFYLKNIPLYNAKRENRRLLGDYVLTQKDFDNEKPFDDAVTYAGWALDLHHPKGMYSGEEGPFYANKVCDIISIPFRCLYSRNIENLLMAGRNISVSHVMLGTCRVEATIATEGQIIGLAAAYCKEKSITPREIYKKHINDFRKLLLKEDITIIGLVNTDKDDLALTSTVKADSTAKGVMISRLPGTATEEIILSTPVSAFPLHGFVSKADYFKVTVHNLSDKPQLLSAKVYADVNPFNALPDKEFANCETVLEPHFYGIVNLPFTTLPESENWGITFVGNDNIALERRSPTKGMMLTRKELSEKFSVIADGLNIFWNKNYDTFVPCNAELLIGTKTRQTALDDSAWVSEAKLPQSVTYTLKKESEISNVQIICDVDLSYPCYSYKRAPHYAGTVSDLTVSVKTNGKWKTVGKVSGNIHRLIRVNFKSVKATDVKITVTKTSGAPYAKLYEVRIYE